jgi:hypothetical protein
VRCSRSSRNENTCRYRLSSELDRLSEAIVDDQCHKQQFFGATMRKRRSNSNNPRRPRGTRGREHSVSGELILYTTEDGQSHIQSRAEGGTVWLSGDRELT